MCVGAFSARRTINSKSIDARARRTTTIDFSG
jgi:hypothetical protein